MARLNSTRLPGYSARHPLEVLDERLLAVADVRVVLDVLRTGVPLDRLARPAVVEHQVVEGLGGLLVGGGAHAGDCRRRGKRVIGPRRPGPGQRQTPRRDGQRHTAEQREPDLVDDDADADQRHAEEHDERHPPPWRTTPVRRRCYQR